jgi:broad specificity phosphatase PhoE
MPDSLIVIRAGATDYELHGRIRGTLDVPLCAAGEEEARQAAGLLPIGPRALYTSRELSALDTSRIVGGRAGLKPRILDGLHNLDQGLWQGLLVDEIRRKQPRLYRQWQDNPWSVAPPEGELLEDACERVERSLEHIHRRHARGLVALVVSDPLDRSGPSGPGRARGNAPWASPGDGSRAAPERAAARKPRGTGPLSRAVARQTGPLQ